jgi:hypothetical protein
LTVSACVLTENLPKQVRENLTLFWRECPSQQVRRPPNLLFACSDAPRYVAQPMFKLKWGDRPVQNAAQHLSPSYTTFLLFLSDLKYHFSVNVLGLDVRF